MVIFRKKSSGSILWYASRDKLEALDANNWPRIESLSGSVDVGFGAAKFQVGLDGADPRILDTVRSADRRLRRSGNVMSIQEISKASPPSALFEFEGPCSRLAAEGAFWVAGKCDGVAVLLVGSLANAVSGRLRNKDDEKWENAVQSASVDPIGGVIRMAAQLARLRVTELVRGPGQPVAGTVPEENNEETVGHLDRMRRLYPQVGSGAERLWIHILQGGLLDVEEGLSSFPIARGVAVYGSRRPFKPKQDRYIEQLHLDLLDELAPEVETIVIGSPVFVENIRNS